MRGVYRRWLGEGEERFYLMVPVDGHLARRGENIWSAALQERDGDLMFERERVKRRD